MAMMAVITAATTTAAGPATTSQTWPNFHQGLPASGCEGACAGADTAGLEDMGNLFLDRKSTRLNSSHSQISYAVFCLKKKKQRPCNVYYTSPLFPQLCTWNSITRCYT